VREHRALREAGRAAGVEDRREIVGLGGAGDERLAIRQRRVLLEHVARAGVVEDVLDLALGEARVDRHDDGAAQLHAPEREHPVSAVAKPDRDAVALAHPAVPQPTRDARRAVPELGVREPFPADLDDRLAVAGAVDGGAQHRHERLRPVGVAGDPVGAALDPAGVEGHGARIVSDA
jgi:hypothetical protein